MTLHDIDHKNHVVSTTTATPSIRDAVFQALERNFSDTGNANHNNIYGLIFEEVESALLQVLLTKYRYNQSKVSRILGLSRGTTRKLMKKYGLLD